MANKSQKKKKAQRRSQPPRPQVRAGQMDSSLNSRASKASPTTPQPAEHGPAKQITPSYEYVGYEMRKISIIAGSMIIILIILTFVL